MSCRAPRGHTRRVARSGCRADEEEPTTASTVAARAYRAWIKATPEAIWQALTNPEWIARYGYGGRIEIELRPGGAYRANSTEQMPAFTAPPVTVEGEVLEVDAPHRLVQTRHAP